MSLFDLLVCPICHAEFDRSPHSLTCLGGHTYPMRDGVPILLTDPSDALLRHEHDLTVRPGYSAWKERAVLKSLTDAQVVLDFGAGNQEVDDPCIIRMDVVFHPFVDVVADIHALPFRSDSIDFAFGGAVFEHLRRPQLAADELFRVLQPGGYVYADWNFVIAYHGYPHHYFNATLDGIRYTFRAFSELSVGIAPFQAPSWALRSIINAYLEDLRPVTHGERHVARLLREVIQFPLHRYDARIPADRWYRTACGHYFFGVKQPSGSESIIPAAVLDAVAASPALRQRFPKPLDLSVPDNVMTWAKSDEGRAHPSVSKALSALEPFSKYGPGRPYDRSTVESWSLELMTEPYFSPETHDVFSTFERRTRPWTQKLRDALAADGVLGLPKRLLKHALWRVTRR